MANNTEFKPDSNHYSTTIVANGEALALDDWQHLSYDAIICTDGAAEHLYHQGLSPDLIIGDMDSLTLDRQLFPLSEFRQIACQQTTDFEKALQYAQSQQLSNILCISVLGKAYDHALYNLSLLHKYAALKLMLLHKFDGQHQWIFPLTQEMELRVQAEQIFSFYPLQDSRVWTQGLKWELNDTQLSPTGYHSIRNLTQSTQLKIKCQGPCLGLIIGPEVPGFIV